MGRGLERGMTFIGARLDALADAAPDAVLLRCGPRRIGRRQFLDAVLARAAHLRREVPEGDRVALCLADPVALLAAFFACARSGRIAVVMDPELPSARLLELTARVGADLAVTAAAPPAGTAEISASAAPPSSGARFYAGFTSGSSGQPKAFVRTQDSWLQSFALSRAAFALPDKSRTVLAGQLTHSLHLYGAVCALDAGEEVTLAPRFDPRALLHELERDGPPAVLYATPTQLHYLSAAASRAGTMERSLTVLSSGAKWPDGARAALQQVLPHARLCEFYGASETSFITCARPEDQVPAGSVGGAAPGVEIAIGDPKRPLPAGEAGPVWVRSALLFDGYLCGAAPETRWKEGWLTVGDHGFLDADGFLHLTGRASRMIVTSGLNVWPEEVEAVLMAHPAVALAVVAGVADPARGQRLEAVVQTDGALDLNDLARHCRDRLDAGKVPRRFHVRETLPLTPGGKPDLQAVTTWLSARSGRVAGEAGQDSGHPDMVS